MRIWEVGTMLKVEHLCSGYSRVPAIHDISFEVGKGQVVAILGSNGAGKTTVLKTITGVLPVMGGTVSYKGESLAGVPSHKMIKKGISMVLEGRHLFPKMTIYDNLMMGAYSVADKNAIKRSLEMVYGLFPILEERKSQLAGTMSGGEQQMVAIGRALMSDPELLILDEPSLGIMPKLVTQIFDFVKQINKMGKTILIVEQNAEQTLAFSDYAYVVANGETIIKGTGAELLDHEDVKKAYLGID